MNGTIERYRLQEWLSFLTSEIHKGFIPLLYPVLAGTYVEAVEPKLERRFSWIDGRGAPSLADTALGGGAVLAHVALPLAADALAAAVGVVAQAAFEGVVQRAADAVRGARSPFRRCARSHRT